MKLPDGGMRWGAILAVATSALAAAPAAWSAGAAAWAERVTADNASERLVQGSDANGGVGDWALGNGVLCAVISDPDHEASLSDRGGVLTDLARCGVAQDEWNSLEILLNMSRDQLLGATGVRAETSRPDGGVAIVVEARRHGLDVETSYELTPARPDALRLVTRARRLPAAESGGDSERAFLFGDIVLHGRRQLAPFTLALEADGSGLLAPGSVGFAHPHSDPDDLLTMVDAILPANLHVLVGGDRQQPGVAYGFRLVDARLEDPDGSSRRVPNLAINGESFSMHGVFTRPFFFGGDSIGLLELAQTLFMDIEPGETLVLTREILVGARSDVASVTDQLWANGPKVSGRTLPAARVQVETAGATPVTEVRPDARGAFSFRVPAPGAYRLTVRGSVHRHVTREFEVPASGVDLGDLALPAVGSVRLPSGEPMRLVFLPKAGGTLPVFGDDLLDFRVGEERYRGSDWARDVSLGGVVSDPAQVELKPGRYRVVATRGPEFSLTETTVEVVAGQSVRLAIEPPLRVLDHPGWVSADLHVHSERSDDSSFLLSRRLAAFAAEGADLIVSSEHDRVVDYAPEIRRLGLQGRMRSLVGVEVTSSGHVGEVPWTAGHSNVFPYPHQPGAFRGGAPRSEGRRLRSIVAEVREPPGPRLVQLNHPRTKWGGVSDLNYFTHLGVAGEPFEPRASLESWPNRVLRERDPGSGLRDLDFDVIELMNGHSMRQYRAVRADWISLLLQGEFRPGVANSDSHVADERVGTPRTYVRLPEGAPTDPENLAPADFVAALRAGRAYGSTGPQLDLALVSGDGAPSRIGDLHSGGTATLSVTVNAAAWVPVSELRVWRSGEEIHRGPIATGTPAVVPVRFERDGFLTVEVSGEPTPAWEEVAPDFVPFAFSNPIFVDADGDGRYTPPGLPPASVPILAPEGD